MEKLKQQWEQCLNFIQGKLTAEQFDAWFKPINVVRFENNTVTLSAPSRFFVEKIEEQYLDLLSSALRQAFGNSIKLIYSYRVADRTVNETDDGRSKILKNKEAKNGSSVSNPFIELAPDEIDPQLNLRYTFDNYCGSKSNQLAISIGQSVSENPYSSPFNPMYIFGATGVGKTHLMQAVGIKIKENMPQARVLYLTARVFENQYTTAVRQNKVNDFINFYLSIDVLLLDDIQEFAGKTATQNTFFHIFNHLHNHHKLLIMTSDCRPSDMEGMVPRLISRFKSGMTVELEKPDYNLRREVLYRKAMQDGLDIPGEVLDYIATHVTDSVRELEGIIISLLAHATMLSQEITIDLAHNVISNSVHVNKRQLTFEKLAEAIAAHFNIDTDLLYGKSRKREINDARQLLMYFAKKEINLSSTNIGMRLSRNHATVLHACKQIEQRLTVEKNFQSEIAEIEKELKLAVQA
ncbi:MAG: chromosomal replication initiator protein DnaA [Bacteroidales bacterium]|uniref:chromosomal replication initiator protein DnaA n=1 Tax=Sodaliphilus sp. TaxID=2815818 RepID=UPI001B527E44|nr:chromosomal replication initiator protein DnaA [Candidatus Sodaliphilus limicaballi]